MKRSTLPRHACTAVVVIASIALLGASHVQLDGPDLLHPAPPTSLPAKGLTYHLADGSEKWDPAARARIVKAMDEAVAIYNANGKFHKVVIANYSPGTATADGNYSGWINFGGQIGTRTALHEIGHALGVGTYKNWNQFSHTGEWTGAHADAELRALDGETAILHCDHQHFWPYGLNYENEGGPANFVKHVKMVTALRADMGITDR